MPFVDPNQLIATGRPLIQEATTSPMFEPEFWAETVPAAFRQDNVVGSAISNQVAQPDYRDFDPDFDPIGFMPDRHQGYEDSYARAYNDTHAMQIMGQIDQEQADRSLLASSGFSGAAATLMAGVFDPINLIPVGGAAYKTYRTGGTLWEGAVATARAGLVTTTAAEINLQATQEIRTLGESALYITAGTVLSGILGAGATAYAKRTGQWEAGLRGFQRDGRALDDTDGLGEAGDLSAAATRSERTTTEMEGVAGDGVVQATARAAAFVDPTLANATSAAKSTRVESAKLTETTVERNKNRLDLESERPAETIARSYQANLYRFLRGIDDDFTQYVVGRSKEFGTLAKIQTLQAFGGHAGKINYGQFRDLVGRVARRGDEAKNLNNLDPKVAEALANDPALKQAVEAAAKKYREEVVTPLKDEAIRLKLLPEDVAVETAESYVNRVWNVEKLKNQKTKFAAKTVEWLKIRRQEAEERVGKFDAEDTKAKERIKGMRRDIRVTHETTYRETFEDAVRNSEVVAFDLFLSLFERGFAPLAKTEAQLVEAAKQAAQRSFQRKYRESLTANLEKAMAEDAAAFEDEVVRLALQAGMRDVAEGADPEDVIKGISLPTSSALGEGNVAAVQRAFDKAIREAHQEATAQAQKLLQRRLGKAKDGEDPEKVFDRFAREINQSVKAAARKASNQAASKATKKIREQLNENIKAMQKLRKQQDRDVFEQELSDTDLARIADEIHGRLINTPAGRLPYDMNINDAGIRGAQRGAHNITKASALKKRAFLIPDEMVEEWLENDVELLSRNLIRGMAPDIAMATKFDGDIMATQAIKNIKEEWDGLQKAAVAEAEAAGKSAKEIEKIEKRMTKQANADIERFVIMRDRLLGIHGIPDDPLAVGARTGAALRKLNYVALLGGMTISAIPDLARIMMVHGFDNTWHDLLVPLTRDMKQLTSGAVGLEMRDMGLAADMILNSRMNAIGEIGDDYARLSKFETGLGAVAETFGMASLMAPWNTMLKQMAGMTTQARMIRAIEADVAGTINKRERSFLRANYIGKDTSRRIAEQLKAHGGKTENGLQYSGWMNWDTSTAAGRSARDSFQAGMNREVNRIIVTPGADQATILFGGEGLITGQHEMSKMFTQFKSFGIAATQRMLVAGLQHRDASFYSGVMMSVTLGMMVSAIKAHDSGIEMPDFSDNPQKWLLEGIDRSGIAGWFFEPNNMLEKASRGHLGLSRLTGAAPMSRYANRTMWGTIFGPTAGLVSKAETIVGSAAGVMTGEGEWSDSDTHAVRRLLPYQNLIGFRYVLDAVERAASREPNQ